MDKARAINATVTMFLHVSILISRTESILIMSSRSWDYKQGWTKTPAFYRSYVVHHFSAWTIKRNTLFIHMTGWTGQKYLSIQLQPLPHFIWDYPPLVVSSSEHLIRRYHPLFQFTPSKNYGGKTANWALPVSPFCGTNRKEIQMTADSIYNLL